MEQSKIRSEYDITLEFSSLTFFARDLMKLTEQTGPEATLTCSFEIDDGTKERIILRIKMLHNSKFGMTTDTSIH